MSAVYFTCWFFNDCCCCCCCSTWNPMENAHRKVEAIVPICWLYAAFAGSSSSAAFKFCLPAWPTSPPPPAVAFACLPAISHPPWWPLKKCQVKCRWQERRRQMIAIMMSIKIMPLSSCCWWSSPATLVTCAWKMSKKRKKERQKLLELSGLSFKYFLRDIFHLNSVS